MIVGEDDGICIVVVDGDDGGDGKSAAIVAGDVVEDAGVVGGGVVEIVGGYEDIGVVDVCVVGLEIVGGGGVGIEFVMAAGAAQLSIGEGGVGGMTAGAAQMSEVGVVGVGGVDGEDGVSG